MKLLSHQFGVSISLKSGFRRLRVRHGCGIQPWTRRKTEDVWTLKEVKAHATCKDCSRRRSEALTTSNVEISLTSGSSSSELDVPVVPFQQVFDDSEIGHQDHLGEEHLVLDYPPVQSTAGTEQSWDLTTEA